jgi:aspartyl-tRNA(Asn)/glutamyl-tRNA(Gln) amidotransferase subunit C
MTFTAENDMKITREIVRHTAELARLDLDVLSEDEVSALQAQLEEIIDYVAQLDELDTTAVMPTTHAVPIEIPLREDQPAPGPGRDEILKNAPRAEAGFFVVPRVITE